MTTERHDSKSEEAEVYDVALSDILEILDHGGEPDLADLKARYAGHDNTVERLFRAACKYHSLKQPLTSGSEDVPLLERGRILGDFEIERFLARGGMGAVYHARQRSLGNRPVALKVLPRSKVSEHSEASFKREALTAASLHHPHLAEIYGFGTHGDLLCYAMRLVEGPTLHDILERLARNSAGRKDRRIRRLIVCRFAEVSSALHTVHQAGLVHRDVKPGNIILDGRKGDDDPLPDHPAVLVDFGLIRAVEPNDRTVTRTTSATPAYAAPEVLLGTNVDARADVFSVGAALHDLLAARRPDERLQASAGLESLHELAPDIDKDLAAITAKAVDPVAAWRYPDAGALCADLEAWLARKAVSARPRGVLESIGVYVRRHPTEVVKAVMKIMGLLAVIAVLASFMQTKYLENRAVEAEREVDLVTLARTLNSLHDSLFGPLLMGSRLQDLDKRFKNDRDPLGEVYD